MKKKKKKNRRLTKIKINETMKENGNVVSMFDNGYPADVISTNRPTLSVVAQGQI